jgi:hypothetical protein
MYFLKFCKYFDNIFQHLDMSVPPSRAQSEVFSASQYGGGGTLSQRQSRYTINYFILPVFILEVVGLACLWALWYYLR